MNAYLDTSALAKWYVPEQGSETVATLLAEVGDVLISALAAAVPILATADLVMRSTAIVLGIEVAFFGVPST